jgi:hypothetical protein
MKEHNLKENIFYNCHFLIFINVIGHSKLHSESLIYSSLNVTKLVKNILQMKK